MIERCERELQAAQPVSPLSRSSHAKCVANRDVNIPKTSSFFVASSVALLCTVSQPLSCPTQLKSFPIRYPEG